jgi:hypothetical protein
MKQLKPFKLITLPISSFKFIPILFNLLSNSPHKSNNKPQNHPPDLNFSHLVSEFPFPGNLNPANFATCGLKINQNGYREKLNYATN